MCLAIINKGLILGCNGHDIRSLGNYQVTVIDNDIEVFICFIIVYDDLITTSQPDLRSGLQTVINRDHVFGDFDLGVRQFNRYRHILAVYFFSTIGNGTRVLFCIKVCTVVFLRSSGNCDGQFSLGYFQSTVFVSDVVACGYFFTVSVLDHCVAGYVVGSSNICLGSGYSYAIDAVTFCQIAVCEAVLGQFSSVVNLGGVICRNGQSLLGYFQSTVCIGDLVTGGNSCTCFVLDHCCAGNVVGSSIYSLAAGYGYAFDAVTCCQCRIGVAVLGQCGTVINLFIAASGNGQRFLCDLKGSVCVSDVVTCGYIYVGCVLDHSSTGYVIAGTN